MSRLRAGDPAPSLRTTDLLGNPVDLSAFRGSYVFLSFFRNAACAICNLRVHELVRRHGELARAGVVVVAVFESPAEALRRHVGRQNPPFPLVADHEGRFYALFGVESSEVKVDSTMELPGTQHIVAAASELGFPLTHEPGSNFHRMPADFLIGPDGTVIHAKYAEYVWDHTPLDTIEALLATAVAD
jgi:peroxiredoxin Q/BCP